LLTELIEHTQLGQFQKFRNDARQVLLLLMGSDQRLYQEFTAVTQALRQREEEEGQMWPT